MDSPGAPPTLVQGVTLKKSHSQRNHPQGEPPLPDPYSSYVKKQTATLADVPSPEALTRWLESHGLDTKEWGKGDTKTVAKFWEEMKGNEAGLEVWTSPRGNPQVMRVTHVLRAKVCSRESYNKDIFLLNTWQQFGDGRTRTRNGLLSEKLTLDEMPFASHVHQVCTRAVTEEEMQRLVPSDFQIGEGTPAPKYDPNYKCPLTVEDEVFRDHIIEIETSKSYPGLLTMYHLYTVDIICKGLPEVDFNTLEFDHEDSKGYRKLKYVHAWVWMGWPQIQRYLFKNSELKERKGAGSFASADALKSYLSKYDLDIGQWGVKEGYQPVSALLTELDQYKAHLEVWGRQDGVPLLMRVVHVIQMQVMNERGGKFLLQVKQQTEGKTPAATSKLLTKSLQTIRLPFDQARLTEAVEEAVLETLSYLQGPEFQLSVGDGDSRPVQGEQTHSRVKMLSAAKLLEHRCVVEQSPTFYKLPTMYHLYSVEVRCSGLPSDDFSSIVFKDGKVKCIGWRWVTWPQTTDILNARAVSLERREAERNDKLDGNTKVLGDLQEAFGRLKMKLPAEDPDVINAMMHVQHAMEYVQELKTSGTGDDLASHLPPEMLLKMAKDTAISEEVLQRAEGFGGPFEVATISHGGWSSPSNGKREGEAPNFCCCQ
mmetsp:Transcript_74015/g.176175  ORF Transcript_74015/g.176175 Transcript_74015/m.176175 type:complete len:652 (-) Transcript_74015:154-2109(-)